MNEVEKKYGKLGFLKRVSLDQELSQPKATVLKSPEAVDHHVYAQYGGGSSSCCASRDSGSCYSSMLSILMCCGGGF